MPLLATDLLPPKGELEPALFPMETVQAVADRVDAYLVEGYAAGRAAGITDTARLDRLARAYAYWKAYAAVVARMLASPATGSLNDGGSYGYSSEQLKQLVAERDRWYDEYLTELPSDDAAPVRRPNETGPTPNQYVW